MFNWQSLDDMLDSEYWACYDGSNLDNMLLSDPERADRIFECAQYYLEYGGDGSTHFEHIQDFRDCLNSLSVSDEGDFGQNDLTTWQYEAIDRDIEKCYLWHKNNGSLDHVIG